MWQIKLAAVLTLALYSSDVKGGLLKDIANKGVITAIGGGVKSVGKEVKEALPDPVAEVVNKVVPDCILGENTVQLDMYTTSMKKGKTVDYNTTGLPINPHDRTFFICHGFTSESNTTDYFSLISTILDRYSEVNMSVHVFSVDWKKGACTTGGIPLVNLLGYPTAVDNTRDIGKLVAKFALKLQREYHIDLKKLTIIGHSLGAHVAGFAGKELVKNGIRIEQIFACDPAGPAFESNDCDNRLCKTDANFVTAIHTSEVLGIKKSIGHVDAFMGPKVKPQPGCTLFTCSHSRSVEYLRATIDDPKCQYIGEMCDSMSGDLESRLSKCPEDTCGRIDLLTYTTPLRGTVCVSLGDEKPYCTIKN